MPRTSSAPLLNGALGVYVLCLKCFGNLAARNGLGDVARTAVATVYTQLGGCQYQGCNPPAWYWKTDYALLSQARRTVAQALMNAGVH